MTAIVIDPRFAACQGGALVGVSGGKRSLRLALSDITCLPAVREWLRANLPVATDAHIDLELDAELVCTELITNAVEHGGGLVEVRIDLLDNPGANAGVNTEVSVGMLVEVEDRDPDGALTPGRSRLGDYRGRGLTIIGSVARWGVRRTATGKTVWATI